MLTEQERLEAYCKGERDRNKRMPFYPDHFEDEESRQLYTNGYNREVFENEKD